MADLEAEQMKVAEKINGTMTERNEQITDGKLYQTEP